MDDDDKQADLGPEAKAAQARLLARLRTEQGEYLSAESVKEQIADLRTEVSDLTARAEGLEAERDHYRQAWAALHADYERFAAQVLHAQYDARERLDRVQSDALALGFEAGKLEAPICHCGVPLDRHDDEHQPVEMPGPLTVAGFARKVAELVASPGAEDLAGEKLAEADLPDLLEVLRERLAEVHSLRERVEARFGPGFLRSGGGE
jgi:hypothetical protein